MKYLKVTNIKLNIDEGKDAAIRQALRIAGVSEKQLIRAKIIKKSIDARRREQMKILWSVGLLVDFYNGRRKNVEVFEQEPRYSYEITGKKQLRFPPVIVGSGPAGLFCGYLLALNGYCPIILERGNDVGQRIDDVARFWREGTLNPDSNVQFGEGGAGTFSDGKLNTGIKDKKHRISFLLETFVKYGAEENILYDAKPHIGTDYLCKIVRQMREDIIRMGGSVHFNAAVKDFLIKDKKITGVLVNGDQKIETDLCILAIGHSARDTFQTLYRRGVVMEQKPFAIGVRVEHLQSRINEAQYGFPDNRLGAAPYKLTYKTKDNRGVYSFCMCPGGYVVNASSENGRLCVNGMSNQKRDTKNANSAIVVTITPNDFPDDSPLSGIALQRALEEKAYLAGNGAVPVQTYGDFVNKRKTSEFGSVRPVHKGAVAFSDIRQILPKYLCDAIEEAISYFGTVIEGFDHQDTLLSAVESRTSSPVRIVRDETFQSNIGGLFPAGEGAGYAGGITSAAIDGMKIFEYLCSQYAPIKAEGFRNF